MRLYARKDKKCIVKQLHSHVFSVCGRYAGMHMGNRIKTIKFAICKAVSTTTMYGHSRKRQRPMKKSLLLAAAVLFGMLPLCAQRLVIGERAPELAVEQWLTAMPAIDGGMVMVAFYHSSYPDNARYVDRLDEIAADNAGRMTVVVVTRESGDAVSDVLLSGQPSYYVAYDADGSVFEVYEAHYVPYSVICGRRGRVQWVGNTLSLTDCDIERITKK